jgi:predicted glycosyltransferase/glycosyltransferase involved in cell wall biosynthesis
MNPEPAGMKRLDHARILMYSHDTFGLGHLRRSRAIAHALVERFKGVTVLIISGSQIAGAFDFRARVDFVKIPSVIKLYNGDYTSIGDHIDLEDTLEMRRSIIENTADAFDPDILIVDKEPLGLRGELEPTLIKLKAKGTTLVLGLRDVMDSAENLEREWTRKNVLERIDALFDQVWVYGPKSFWQPLKGLKLPEGLEKRISYTGFLRREVPADEHHMAHSLPEHYILVTAGGGGDGAGLMRNVLAAREHNRRLTFPLVMVLGPFMKGDTQEEIHQRAEKLKNITVIDFDNELETILNRAAAVIGMCGYNTFCEIISFDRPTLFMPRTHPREEQLIRAERAMELGWVNVLSAENAEDAEIMANTLRNLPDRPVPSASNAPIDLSGLENICGLVEKTLHGADTLKPTVKPVRKRIAVIVKGYPRLSETFIAQEILSLEKAGFDLEIVSLRHPTDKKRHPVHHEISAKVNYLPEYLHQEPLRVLKAWWKVRKLPGYKKAYQIWRRDLRRDRSQNRIRRFGQAMVLAAELGDDFTWLYGHFIHTPGSVTRYAGTMRALPWSFSAHAKDIWTSPDWELSEKLGDAQWTVTCTAGGADHLKKLSPDAEKVHLVYHGLNLERFSLPEKAMQSRDGSDEDNPLRIVTVGRAVEKKGLDTLLDALAKLPRTLHWRWVHIGGGPLLDDLKAQGERLGLSERLNFLGSRSQQEVLETYRSSDLFVLPCRIAADGDRDGLPNVIVEAQSQKLTCISTPISGIPELIEDGANGLLVEPNRPDLLAGAIEKLAADPALRAQYGEEGRRRVEVGFDAANEIDLLVKLLGGTNAVVGEEDVK